VAQPSRRSIIAAAAPFAAPSLARAASAEYRGWTRSSGSGALPLDVHVDTGAGVRTLGDWLGGRPAVLALWATWCGPCLVEKPSQMAMARRLAAHNAPARILILQAYDDVDLARGRAVLARLGAADLVNAAAMPDAEAAFIRLLGASEVQDNRTAMPWHLLIDSRGRELGRAVGLMTGADGGYTYFEDDATFEFLRGLG
jgi:thiol-disulfide isomerase/thioredoxin